jgi:class 3 adenylate cyclase
MTRLSARDRANLPDRAFAYIDSTGTRRLPIHDEAHVRNALGRFERVRFEDDAARERARLRLLKAAKRYGIVPVGFITGQLRSERSDRGSDFSTFPTGTVTFLLTDIEGSTVLVHRLGDRYASVLKDVRAIIRDAVRREGGRKVDAPGDEYLSVFQRPASAVSCALDIQRSMAEHVWPLGSEVKVRAGIHRGRPTLTDAGYVGVAVNTVARICSAGHGGQILISDKTKAAVEGTMPAGVELRSLGRHRLAGLPHPELIHQVHVNGMPTRFPPLRTTP